MPKQSPSAQVMIYASIASNVAIALSKFAAAALIGIAIAALGIALSHAFARRPRY